MYEKRGGVGTQKSCREMTEKILHRVIFIFAKIKSGSEGVGGRCGVTKGHRWGSLAHSRHWLGFQGGHSLRLNHSPNKQQCNKALHWKALRFLTIVVLHNLMFSALALRNETTWAGQAGAVYTAQKTKTTEVKGLGGSCDAPCHEGGSAGVPPPVAGICFTSLDG